MNSFLVNQRGVRLDPVFFCKDFTHWVRLHMGAKSIITNRTHSSILGTILGKETTLFPSSYHKNLSVWEYSLKKRNVQWADGEKISEVKLKNDLTDYLPKFLKKSYKVERCFRFFQGVPLK